MKQSIRNYSLALLALLLISPLLNAQNIYVSSKWNDGVFTYKTRSGGSSLEINYKGEIQVNSSDTDVTSISDDGYLKINQTTFGNKRSILLEGGPDGKVTRTYYEGRKSRPFDEEAKRWLADVLIKAVRVTGIAAESRVQRFYNKGGTYAVLDEIRKISSNSGKGRYFDVLLAIPNVKDVSVIAERMGSYISSNSTRGSLFRKHAERFMKDKNTAKAMLRGIGKMTSSSEKGSILKHLIEKYDITADMYEGIFDVLRGIHSNSERGSVLRRLNSNFTPSPTFLNGYSSVLNSMSSSSERGSVLRDLLRRNQSPEVIKMALGALLKFNSNSEISSVLRDIAPLIKGQDELYTGYYQVVRRMTSNSEISNALTALLRSGSIKSTESKIGLLEATRYLTSNTSRGVVLRRAVDLLGSDARVGNAFFDSVKGMTSDSEISSVLRSVISKPGLKKMTMLSIIDATRRMTSNTEIGNVLTSLCRVMPKNDSELKNAVRSAAARLTSDSEYRRVIEMLD